ncbi:hypothetical protein COY17_00485 [Candidatus Saccharibacteria bacterium CG_4_10_14_0_2_um_filter_52_9]|nr:MAG: hypothetical protein COY17_00485 [Candidatus Saccharibacteria bacterium CG_4_10_14_0_2_um_filter_52_9]
MYLIISVVAIFILLVAGELWWRRQNIHGEFSRKSIHIIVGSFVATWPFFLSWTQIELLSVTFLLAVIVSQYFGVFQAIHSVQRSTWGEAFFALAVGGVALVTHDQWIYTAALLQMSLADGMAAVVGIRHPGRYKYAIFGHAKSLSGTSTFFVFSVIILLACSHFGGLSLGLGWVLGISVLLSVLENLAIVGLDNLLIPMAVALLLVHR